MKRLWSLFFASGLAVAALGVLGLLLGSVPLAHADPGVYYVSSNGDDANACTDPEWPCRSIQAAVDRASAGDEVRVLGLSTTPPFLVSGVYTGVNEYAGLRQVVYISKELTLSGEWVYNGIFGLSRRASAHTVIDAQGLGRGIVISGPVQVTLEGLRVVNGDASGLGGGPSGADAGGGVAVFSATLQTPFRLIVTGSLASAAGSGYGGGMLLSGASGLISGTQFSENVASSAGWGEGGALYVVGSQDVRVQGGRFSNNMASTAAAGATGGAIAVRNTVAITLDAVLFSSNHAACPTCPGLAWGGALAAVDSGLTVSGSQFVENGAAGSGGSGYGGAVAAVDSDVTVSGSWFLDNDAAGSGGSGYGGALAVDGGSAGLLGNEWSGNRAAQVGDVGEGGAVFAEGEALLALTNNLLHGQVASSAIALSGMAQASLVHNTLAGNEGWALQTRAGATAWLTNTIVAGNGGGLAGPGGVFPFATLFWDNTALGNGEEGLGAILANPAFADAQYRLGPLSPAIDGGVDAGVSDDWEGQPRDTIPDLGFDEYYDPQCAVCLNDMPYRTLHGAVAAAGDGDTIRVAGTCHEHDLLVTRTLTLEGGWNADFTVHDPDQYTSTVDAQQAGRVFALVGQTGGQSGTIAPTLRDLSLINGLATFSEPAPGLGGGVYASGATPRLLNVTIRDCTAYNGTQSGYGMGGGAYIASAGASTLISASAFIDNVALQTTVRTIPNRYGGGLYLSGPATIQSTLFHGNAAGLGGAQFDPNYNQGWGGGLYLTGGRVDVLSNTIQYNTAFQADLGNGGGMALVNPAAGSRVEGNLIRNNRGGGRDSYLRSCLGGGVFQRWGGPVTWQDNQILDNESRDEASNGGSYGGGLYLIATEALFSGTNRIEGNRAGPYWGQGGGVFIGNSSVVTMSGASILNNSISGIETADMSVAGGAGVYLSGGRLTLENVLLQGNTGDALTAALTGGGLYASGAQVRAVGSRFADNHISAASADGGGLYVTGGTLDLQACEVLGNSVTAGHEGSGGGLYLSGSTQVTLTGNLLRDNRASGSVGAYRSSGGGLALFGTLTTTLDANWILSNTVSSTRNFLAVYGGAGVYVNSPGPVLLSNNVIARNHVSAQYTAYAGAAGVHAASALQMVHNTLADNTGAATSGVQSMGATLVMTNNVIAGHVSGIQAPAGTITPVRTLFWGNDSDGLRGSDALDGDPAFVDAPGQDYHIRSTSAALDAGLFAGLASDLDGDLRPTNPARPDAPDLGADEYAALTVRRLFMPSVTFGAACTRIVFTGTPALEAITTTVLPLRWPTTMPGDMVVARTVIITPSSNLPVSATLSLCYDEGELGSLLESQLQLYRWTGSAWEPYASTVDVENNLVTASGITGFSPWLIGDRSEAPTAVHVQGFTARPAAGAWLWVLLSVLTAGAGVLGLLRRRGQ